MTLFLTFLGGAIVGGVILIVLCACALGGECDNEVERMYEAQKQWEYEMRMKESKHE